MLRAAIGLWPGFAVVWDAQQFVAPLALAEAVGVGLLAAWAAGAHVADPGRSAIGPGEGEHHQPRVGRPGLAIAGALVLAPLPLPPPRPPAGLCPGGPGARPGGGARPGMRRPGWRRRR